MAALVFGCVCLTLASCQRMHVDHLACMTTWCRAINVIGVAKSDRQKYYAAYCSREITELGNTGSRVLDIM